MNDAASTIASAVETAAGVVYDRVAVRRSSVLRSGTEYHTGFESWEEYQSKAGLRLMDEIADRQIRNCQIAVASFGAAAGLGGLLTVAPDTLQFLALTLRMCTGIAAAYGFDPDPYANRGKTKILVMQAYLNANLGQAPQKGIEAMSLGATAGLLRSAVAHSQLLMKLIMLIGKILGLRLTRQGILRAIPLVSSGANAGFNWFCARQIAQSVKADFRQFRDEIRSGRYRDDPAYEAYG